MMYHNNFIAVIKYRGKIMRETKGVVRLPFGSEYSILLKNKDSRTAVAKIEVDGKDVMGGRRYIVPGNSTRELEGFMKGLRVTHKFRSIQKTKEIANFRGDRIDDGMVRVEFWYEQKNEFVTPWLIYGDPDTTFGGNSGSNYRMDWTNNTGGFSSGNSSFSCSNNLYHCNNSGFKKCTKSLVDPSLTSPKIEPKADEVITVKGSKSNQRFNYGTVGALESQSSVIVIRLKGAIKKRGRVRKVKRAVTVKTKIQCPTCGRRWRSSMKFCGNCSTALD